GPRGAHAFGPADEVGAFSHARLLSGPSGDRRRGHAEPTKYTPVATGGASHGLPVDGSCQPWKDQCMGLREYRRKRNFKDTPEPPGKISRPARAGTRPRAFVIQKQAASRLHYDFRLELDGTLNS